MIDLLQLQRDIYALLMSAPALASVNIVLERQFMVDSTVELDAIWQTVRNERSGNGILVEKPTARVTSPNVRSMPQDVTLNLVAFQNGDAAFTPETGSGHAAENLAQIILGILHLQAIIGVGQLQAVGHSAAREFEFINAERATLRISGVDSDATARCAGLGYSNVANEITLTCATSGAVIYYTTDGSSPMDPTLTETISGEVINPNSHLYAAPFAVIAGERVRAIAQAPGFNASEILSKTIL